MGLADFAGKKFLIIHHYVGGAPGSFLRGLSPLQFESFRVTLPEPMHDDMHALLFGPLEAPLSVSTSRDKAFWDYTGNMYKYVACEKHFVA